MEISEDDKKDLSDNKENIKRLMACTQGLIIKHDNGDLLNLTLALQTIVSDLAYMYKKVVALEDALEMDTGKRKRPDLSNDVNML